MTMTFKNVAKNAPDYPYMVFRRDPDDFFTLWYWGAYADRNEANEAALDIGGETWHTEDVLANKVEMGW